jgi:hypothetical protein
MPRMSKLQEVFAELTALLGDQFTPFEILQFAGLVLRTHRDVDRIDRSFLERVFRPSAHSLPVDTAMTRYDGFGVVSFESRSGMSLTDDRPDNQHQVTVRIRAFVGQTQWPRTGTV